SRILHDMKKPLQNFMLLHNDAVSPLFMAAIEATEEAIINSLLAATTTISKGNTVEALPVDKVLTILKKYNRIK
ncbi:MAG: P1 family peptidase, partial [Chitinophagaceae bacterium]